MYWFVIIQLRDGFLPFGPYKSEEEALESSVLAQERWGGFVTVFPSLQKDKYVARDEWLNEKRGGMSGPSSDIGRT